MSGYPSNTQDPSGVYIGEAYAFDASGGFTIEQTFPEIEVQDTNVANRFDVTDSLQIKYPVRRFNDKIAVTKDETNSKPLFVEFDASNDTLINDTLTISSSELLDFLTTDTILSMGRLSSLYSDFNYTVLEYFGAPFGFSTLFKGEQMYNINNGVFDASALLQLFNKFDFNINGTLVTDLSGYFTIHNISENLRYASGTDIFDNRHMDDNIGVNDGFIAGDLIYIPNGLSVTLKVDIETEPYNPISNIGPTNLSGINNLINYSEPQTNIRKETTSSVQNITQTTNVPILICLTNEDFGAYSTYGHKWNKVTELDDKKWLAISLSASGKYQTAIEEDGDIYKSIDFGRTWTQSQNVGTAATNSISISLTGQYQTIGNGHQIFVSNNYGITWSEVYNFGTAQIFVAMALTGKYQAVLSSGDGLYQSSDFGQTWNKHLNISDDLYNSLQAFPTFGISMSYDGKRQVIVCEAIYLSNDYGETWTTTTINPGANEEFDDHNWVGVDMSSDGQYISAIEVTGEVYLSNDFGESWTKVLANNVQDKQWQSISISATGRFQTALVKTGNIFVSSDFGVTWVKSADSTLQPSKWQCNSVSANGMYQAAAAYDGGLYTAMIYD